MTESESDLRLLAGAYFHQDFRLDAPDVDSVVRQFARDEGAESAEHAAAEIVDALAPSPSEEQLAQLWSVDLGAEFNPNSNGLTYRAWFERMLEILRSTG